MTPRSELEVHERNLLVDLTENFQREYRDDGRGDGDAEPRVFDEPVLHAPIAIDDTERKCGDRNQNDGRMFRDEPDVRNPA